MIARCCILAAICWAAALPACAQDDYLTDGETAAIRDQQEPDKRLILYMDFAERRLDAVKQALASAKKDAGDAARKMLTEYVHIMEDVDSTLEDARDRRVPLTKALKDIETRGKEYLTYLGSLNESSPGWKDYEYTVAEARDMTRDELAEAAKGAFPEVKERKPPADLPPPSARPPDRKSNPSEQEGPPRKSQPSR
jgi:hypothetical protein